MGKKKEGGKVYSGIPIDAFSDGSQPTNISPAEIATIIKFSLSDMFHQSSTNGSIQDPIKGDGDIRFTEDLYRATTEIGKEGLPISQ
jgi:hypothetical protein